jgi:hypothetical protein
MRTHSSVILALFLFIGLAQVAMTFGQTAPSGKWLHIRATRPLPLTKNSSFPIGLRKSVGTSASY